MTFPLIPLPGRPTPARQLPPSRRRLAALLLCLLLLAAGIPTGLTGCQDAPSAEDADAFPLPAAAELRQSYETYQAGGPSQAAFADLAHTIFIEEACSDTLTLHYNLAVPADFGIRDYAVTLGDFSADAYRQSVQRAQTCLEQLKKIPRENVADTQRLTYDILAASLEQSVRFGDYYYYQEPLKPASGIQAQLPVLLAEYHFRSTTDIEDYLALCADLPRYFGQLLSFEQEKAQAGLFMSDDVLAQILTQCRDFCAKPEENFMLEAFDDAVGRLDWLTEEEKRSYQAQNRETILSQVIPAYETLIQGLTALQGSGRNPGGLCRFEQGGEYYRLLARQATGSSRPVEELIRLVSERMLNDLRAMSQIYETTADLGQQLTQTFSLTDPQMILLDLQSQMRNDFPALPDTACEVKYVPPALETHLSPAFYLVPPLDALTENCIYVNKAATDTSRLYTTLAHEGYPGHLYQTVYSASCQSEPLRSLLNFKGFTEGWATYVERLSYGYETNFSPELTEFLTHNASATLALYALCDMNIHLNGWDLEQTRQFLSAFISGLEETTVSEIYLAIVANPGNYLSYHVGAMEFELLREDAEARLGDAFDAREFHTVILETGACPFDVLTKEIGDWMATAAGS